MEFVDYYKVMGVPVSASADDIKRAYRKLARKYHPDVSQEKDSAARFKEVGEAYRVLKDPERRAEYDELYRYGGAREQAFTPPPGWQSRQEYDADDSHYANEQQFSEFFEKIFADRARRSSPGYTSQGFTSQGQDIHSDLTISLNDAFHGSTVSVNLLKPVILPDGRIHEEHSRLNVKIPRGVIQDQKLRLRGQGGPASGDGKQGDLYVHLHIQEDEYFHLSGKDVSVNLPITPWEAALGATVEVRTLDGIVNLTIPENSHPGRKLRLKGKGLPGKPPGDQYVVLSVVFPEATTPDQREFYQKMSTLWSFNPRQSSVRTG